MPRKRSTTIQIPEDLYEKLEEIKETMGSSHNFVIERALRAFFAEDIEMKTKPPKEEVDNEHI